MFVNMKISFVLLCTCAMFSIKRAHGSAIGTPFYPLDPEDLSDGDIKELEFWDKYYHRPKRTLLPPDPIAGSAAVLTHLKTAALAGAKHKIGALASGSAGAVAGAAAAASMGAKGALVHVGKSVGGAVAGSAGAINLLKAALLTEAKNKIVGVATGAAAAAAGSISGSAKAINALKTAALTGISKKIGQIASGSAKTAAGASAGIGLASTGAIKHLKTAAVHGIVTKIATGSAKAAWGLATAGVSAVGQGAHGLKGAVFGSANFFHQLKSALIAGITKAATGASVGLKTKIGQVSGDLAAGSADVIGQLKHAVVAGTKKKLGQAASGLAGAFTGAVGSASAGAGQLARGVFIESGNLVNQLKTGVVSVIKTKVGQVASGSAGLVAAGSAGLANKAKGAASAIAQANLAALAGASKAVGHVASASVGAAAGTAFKASTGLGQLGAGAVKGSFSAINQIKSAAISGIGKVASLSAGAVTGASGHIVKTAALGSGKLKSAAVAGTKHTIGAIASGSVGAVAGLSGGKYKRSVGYEPVDQFLDLPKRSQSAWSTGSGQGSADIINQLKSAVVAGLTKKIGQVAKGSAGAIAGASAGFSKGSFGGGDAKGYQPHPYEPSGPSYDHKPQVNVWELKKSVLNTLLQAVKAIKGGVLAIKGQLIKGSGLVVAGSGKLIAAGGDKVSSLGKNIISNAILIPPHKDHPEYGHPSASYTAPSGPPVVYDAPPSSGPSYESHYESQYDHHHDKPPHGSHSGILILKRIPSTKDTYHTSHSNPEGYKVPAFKPLSPTGPSFGSVVGKFFTASTSLDTGHPTPFGDTGHGEVYDSHGESHYPVEPSIHPPAPQYYEEPRTKFEAAPPPSFQAPLIKEHKLGPTSVSADFGTSDFGGHAPNYVVPFENTHNFVNINHHLGGEASTTNEQKIKLTKGEILDHLEASPTLASSQITLPKNAPQSFDALKTALKSNMFRKPSRSEVSSNNAASGEILYKPASTNYLEGDLYSQKAGGKQSAEDLFVDTQKYSPTYARFKKTPSQSSFSQSLVATKDNSLEHFLPRERPKTPFDSKEVSSGFSSAENYHRYLEHFPFHKVNPSFFESSPSKTSKSRSPQKLRMQSDHRQRRPLNTGGYSIVKSMTYEITPDGAKKLT